MIPMRFFLALASVFVLTATVHAQSARTSAAIGHLRHEAPALGLDAADLADLAVTDAYVSRRSGVSHVYLRQQLDGLDVIGSEITMNVDRQGTVFHRAGTPLSGLAKRATSRRASLTATAAVQRAANLAEMTAPSGLRATQASAGPARKTTFAAAGLAAEPVEARLVYHPDARGDLRQAWEVGLYTPDRQHFWLVYVDAATGAELARHDLVIHDSFGHSHAHEAEAHSEHTPVATAERQSGPAAAYRVYPFPIESPNHGSRSLVSDPYDIFASPDGWHDDGTSTYTITRGNNVHAYRDDDADGTPEPGESPDGGSSLVFDFPVNLSQSPSAYADAAVTNLFYWNNLIHDILYQYGFDEAAGNFQQNNYGNGGVGGDYVRAEAQDGGGSNNANFFTPADGSRPRMQMYLWNYTNPGRDGDFDNGIIVHEYVHGLSNRLTGGPSATACLVNQEQMGEGWSDYYALMLTLEAGDTGTDPRGIGTYVRGEPTDGVGIRPTPYSTNFAINGVTYGDVGSQAIPHGVGYVWATMLWDATWELIDLYGFSPDIHDATGTAGNQVMLNLVTEAMKLQPCTPGFVDGRDAILAADQALYGGAYSADLWRAFARRGLGIDADQGSSSVTGDETEDFTEPGPPPVAEVSPASVSASAPSGGSTTSTVTLSNVAAAGSRSLNFSAALLASSPAVRFGSNEESTTDAFSGSDSFGYTWTESSEPGGPAVDFQDISGTGSALTFTPTGSFPAGDEGYADVALPFAFPFYGTNRTSVRVLSNGLLTFSSFASNSFSNEALPNSDAPDALIAPLWDDLNQSDGGTVYAGSLADGRFVIQWNEVPRYNQSGTSLTFEVILSPDGTVEYQYASLLGTLSADAGIENDTGTVGLSTTDAIASNSAVRITPPLPWVSVSPASGSVLAGASTSLDLTLDGADLTDGTYTADLRIGTNDPDNPVLTVPVTFTVGTGGGTVTMTAVRTSGPTVSSTGGTVSYDLTFTNTSGADFTGEYWVFATLPNGNQFGPVFGPAPLSLADGATISESLTGNVPRRAPAGEYTVTAYVGAAFPDEVDDSSSFTFSKSSSLASQEFRSSDTDALTWTTENLTRGTTAAATLSPAEAEAQVTLVGAYPSPFRDRTLVRYTLAEDTAVRVVVYDLLGRQVAVLTDEVEAAGTHEVVFDAIHLPSGVYVLRLEAGSHAQTQRVTLLK